MCAKKGQCVISQWGEDFLSRHLECGDNVASKEPSCVKASGEVAVFICSLRWGIDRIRIEEEVVVASSGHKVITRFPVEELIVCPIT